MLYEAESLQTFERSLQILKFIHVAKPETFKMEIMAKIRNKLILYSRSFFTSNKLVLNYREPKSFMRVKIFCCFAAPCVSLPVVTILQKSLFNLPSENILLGNSSFSLNLPKKIIENLKTFLYSVLYLGDLSIKEN